MDKKNHIITMVAIVIVVAGGAFYGGMQYGSSKTAAAQLAQGGRGIGGGANGTGGQRGAGQGAGARGGANGGGGFTSGQILAKDDTSITVKSNDGSSKIVFFSSSTGIDKSVAGSSSDLSVGQQVMVNGKANADGSVAASTIQIRPAAPAQPAQ